ncbi:MAG TPA: methyltransferase [Usitatibacteraceae bacterium]
MTAPNFPKHDPAEAEFWNLRFDAAFTPWDQGGVPASLQSWATRASGNPAPRVLIPGCGSAYEVRFLAGLGWQVSAIDFSPAAVAQAKRVLGPLAGHVHLADFFADDLAGAPFDLIYERAFLCALPRRLWRAWAVRVAELLKPGGSLAGFFFSDEGEKGPPFGLHDGELEAMLQTHFTRRQKRRPTDSVPVFAGKESWQVWERNA